MDNSSYDAEELVSLIGLSRSDNKVQTFINQFGTAPVFTVDKEDDADDEFVEFKEQGLAICFEKDVLMSICLHSGERTADFATYGHPLPMGICFEQSKSELLDSFGSPAAEGGGHDAFFGDVPDWFRYKMDGYSVHMQFAPDLRSIRTVTVMVSPD